MNQPETKTNSTQRVQNSILAGIEKKALLWIAPRLPHWVGSDLLTALGLFSMAVIGFSYYMTLKHWLFFILADVGLFLNWFGDSLDGTLARVRNQQRPRYGYYLDHLVDAFGISFVMFGLAFSGLVTPLYVWVVLTLFFIASINTYLATNSVHVFKISYLRVSTTEARVILIILNTILIFVKRITIFGVSGYLLDFIGILMSLFLLFAVLRNASKNLRLLNREERAVWDKKYREKSG